MIGMEGKRLCGGEGWGDHRWDGETVTVMGSNSEAAARKCIQSAILCSVQRWREREE